MKGIRQGWLLVDEIEAALDPGLMSAAERWLFYFSLRSSEVELRDAGGRLLTPDELVPEFRPTQRRPVEERAIEDEDEPLSWDDER